MSSQIFIAYNSSWYEFFDTNYLKCSNNFAADCTFLAKSHVFKREKENLILMDTIFKETYQNWMSIEILIILGNFDKLCCFARIRALKNIIIAEESKSHRLPGACEQKLNILTLKNLLIKIYQHFLIVLNIFQQG